MRYTIIALSSLLTTIQAITFTSPAPNANVDPTQPIIIRWTSTSSDPSTFNLIMTGSTESIVIYGAADRRQIAADVQTSSGSYTIPAGSITGYGSSLSFSASTPTGDNIASSGNFVIGYATRHELMLFNRQESSPVPSGASLTSIVFDTSGLEGQSVTASYFPGTGTGPAVTVTPTGSGTSGGGITLSGTGIPSATGSLTSLSFTTDGVTGSMTIMPTTTTARSGSATSSGASSSSSLVQATANAQPKVGVGKEVMSVAGFLAGLVALVA